MNCGQFSTNSPSPCKLFLGEFFLPVPMTSASLLPILQRRATFPRASLLASRNSLCRLLISGTTPAKSRHNALSRLISTQGILKNRGLAAAIFLFLRHSSRSELANSAPKTPFLQILRAIQVSSGLTAPSGTPTPALSVAVRKARHLFGALNQCDLAAHALRRNFEWRAFADGAV